MKWLGRLIAILAVAYGGLFIVGFYRAFGPVDHSSVQIARSKLPEASKWIASLPVLEENQQLILPPNLKDMLGPNGTISVRKYDDDLWVVFRCYEENIDNGEGFAYCIKPKKDSIPNFEEQQLGGKRIDQHWVYFRFT